MKNNARKIDYLIIGQGLAGSLLAWELIQRQKKVIIVDKGSVNASLIAAGLINPITGMRLVKSTYVDQLLPVAMNCYKKLSNYFQQLFYIEKPMLRVLRDDKELICYQKRQQQPEYQSYLADLIPSPSLINAPFGLLKQKKTGYLLTKPLLTALKNYFISSHVYLNAEINYPDIQITPTLSWRNIYPKQLIFCEGYQATDNPWFLNLPFQLSKGEIITASVSEKIPQNILNYGHWFIPLNTHQFRTGATFDRENLNMLKTVEAKKRLLDSLKQVCPTISIDQIISQQAGIRATTQDKQPFIGTHPTYKELVIFNGFGTKGSLQIPWYCQRLADHLINNASIPLSSDVLRFKQ